MKNLNVVYKSIIWIFHCCVKNNSGDLVNKLALHFYIFFLIIGCSSPRYGHSLDDWNNFTEQQREEIKTTAENNVYELHEIQREKEFVNKPVNTLFGTRSNTY